MTISVSGETAASTQRFDWFDRVGPDGPVAKLPTAETVADAILNPDKLERTYNALWSTLDQLGSWTVFLSVNDLMRHSANGFDLCRLRRDVSRRVGRNIPEGSFPPWVVKVACCEIILRVA